MSQNLFKSSVLFILVMKHFLKRGIIKNKTAQFYLIAALIIAVSVIVVVGVANYAGTKNKGDSVKLYEVSEELKLEGEQVVNYGIFTDTELETLLNDFSTNYGEYVVGGQDFDAYFIYGNRDWIKAVAYKQVREGNIGLNIGGSQQIFQIIGRNTAPSQIDKITQIGSNVIVNIAGTNYDFDIKEGQNFFFIVRQPSKV